MLNTLVFKRPKAKVMKKKKVISQMGTRVIANRQVLCTYMYASMYTKLFSKKSSTHVGCL